MLASQPLRLQEVAPDDYADLGFLYGVLIRRLEERDTNISHRQMPSWNDHVAFIKSEPYQAHYIINDGWIHVGVCYLSKKNEIGIWVAPEHRREGVASFAVREIMTQHPGPWLANINPRNRASIAFFRKLGFRLKADEDVQLVYEC